MARGEFSDSDFTDGDLLRVMQEFEERNPEYSPKKVRQTSINSSFRQQRSVRQPRTPRKRKAGEWDSDLSEYENDQRFHRNRMANRRRRMKRMRLDPRDWKPALRAEIDEVPSIEEVWDYRTPSFVGVRRQRLPNFGRLEASDSDVPGPHARTRAQKQARIDRMRRQDRDRTPEWLLVPAADRHRYMKVTNIGGINASLKEYTEHWSRADFTPEPNCNVCSGQHSVGDCPKEGHDTEFEGGDEFESLVEEMDRRSSRVDMGKLFQFLT